MRAAGCTEHATTPDRAERRRGIARALVEAGETHLRAQGAFRVNALVGDRDEVAGALWRSAGYEADAETMRMVRNL